METEYDIFEVSADLTIRWHICVSGKKRALNALKIVGLQTLNQCFATELKTGEIIGWANKKETASAPKLKN